jgi:hypothetical protein
LLTGSTVDTPAGAWVAAEFTGTSARDTLKVSAIGEFDADAVRVDDAKWFIGADMLENTVEAIETIGTLGWILRVGSPVVVDDHLVLIRAWEKSDAGPPFSGFVRPLHNSHSRPGRFFETAGERHVRGATGTMVAIDEMRIAGARRQSGVDASIGESAKVVSLISRRVFGGVRTPDAGP